MKQFLILVAGLLFTSAVYGQALPDPDSTEPGAFHYYYENLGQIVDDSGVQQPQVRFYTDRTSPKLFLADDKISFQARYNSGDTSVADTGYRVDMHFLCSGTQQIEPCGTVQAFDQSQDLLNYFLPQDTNGITGVRGFARVVYQNAFPNIDAHCYSNPHGFKMLFDFKPGADTNNFILQFTGQDSIVAVTNFLNLYLGDHGFAFPQAIAYQVNSTGMIVPLSWTPTWVHNGGGIVKMIFGSYNPSMEMIISVGNVGMKMTSVGTDNLVWTTYYGGTADDASPSFVNNGMPYVRTTPDGSRVYQLMTTKSTNLGQNGIYVIRTTPYGDYDCLISEFNHLGERTWATYFGGAETEEGTAIEILSPDPNNYFGNLLISGRTTSYYIPNPVAGSATPVFRKTQNSRSTCNTCTGSFLAGFDASNGYLRYSTFYGAGDKCFINDLHYDNEHGDIYFCGYVLLGTSPWSSLVDISSNTPTSGQLSLRKSGSSAYFQTSDPTAQSGLVGRIKESDRSLKWATLLGGDNKDYLNEIIHENTQSRNGTYVIGNTISSASSLPLAPSSGVAYRQTAITNQHGLITHFNSNDVIDWCTYFGASGNEEYTGLALNSIGDLYITGVTTGGDPVTSPTQSQNNSNQVPVFASGSSYTQPPGNVPFVPGTPNTNTDAIIARFNSNHQLTWCTFFGRRGEELNPTRVIVDAADNVYISGNNKILLTSSIQEGIPTFSVGGRYNQPNNATANLGATFPTPPLVGQEAVDGWIAHFRSNNSIVWSTLYGGDLPGALSDPLDFDTRATNRPYEEISSIDCGTGEEDGFDKLYMTGVTLNTGTPMYFSNGSPRKYSSSKCYFDHNYNGGWDTFIGKFEDARSTSVKDKRLSVSINTLVIPNPSSDFFSVSFDNANSNIKESKVIVFNAVGQMLFDHQMSVQFGQNKFRLDLRSVPSGTYFLSITTTDGSSTTKLIKE